MTLPLVYLGESPYQQGFDHGQTLRDRIANNLAIYFERFERELKLSRAEVFRRASRYAEAILRQAPEYHAGMRGIAEGSGFSFEEIVALNVRYELCYYQFGVNAMADGCTAFALEPHVTAEGHLLIGENWDWITGVQGAVLHTSTEDLVTLAFTEAGIFGGKIGLNSAGLGLAINGLTSSDDDWSRLATPFHVRCYQVLRSREIEDAVRVIADGVRSCSTNFLLAQAPDRVINIEAAPHSVRLENCRDGCLVHANHFVDPHLLNISEPPIEKNPHSYWRHARLRDLLATSVPISLEQLKQALRDHDQHPYSVCFHHDPSEPPEEHYATVVSAIMDLHAQMLYLSDGPPCVAEHQRYAL